MPYSPAVASARGALSNHHRWHPDDTEGLAERRRELVTEKLASQIERALTDEVDLTGAQVDRLVALLRAGGAR
jgi:hypothetical protein